MVVVSIQAACKENTDKNTLTPVNNTEFSQVQHRPGKLLKQTLNISINLLNYNPQLLFLVRGPKIRKTKKDFFFFWFPSIWWQKAQVITIGVQTVATGAGS